MAFGSRGCRRNSGVPCATGAGLRRPGPRDFDRPSFGTRGSVGAHRTGSMGAGLAFSAKSGSMVEKMEDGVHAW